MIVLCMNTKYGLLSELKVYKKHIIEDVNHDCAMYEYKIEIPNDEG